MSRFWALLLGSRCTACTKAVVSGDAICGSCADRARIAPVVAHAVLPDGDGFDRMVRTFKRGVVRQLGQELATLTIERWARGQLDLPSSDQIDLISWVPHARVRAAQRGCHAPEVYARALAVQLGIPVRCLLRRTLEAPQRGRDIAGRRDHARRSFAVERDCDRWKDQRARVLIVDDVRTTGATLDACCELLDELGMTASQLAIVAVPRLAAAFPGRNYGESL